MLESVSSWLSMYNLIYKGTKTISNFTETSQFDIGNLTQLKDTQEEAHRPHFLENNLMIETLRLLNRIMKIMIRMSAIKYIIVL